MVLVNDLMLKTNAIMHHRCQTLCNAYVQTLIYVKYNHQNITWQTWNIIHALYRIHILFLWAVLKLDSKNRHPLIVPPQNISSSLQQKNNSHADPEWHELVCKWWNHFDFWVNYAFKALSNHHCSICGLLCQFACFKLLIRPWELHTLVSLHFCSHHIPQILSVSSCYIYSPFSNTLSFVLFLLILF